jgi:hypothetical protein
VLSLNENQLFFRIIGSKQDNEINGNKKGHDYIVAFALIKNQISY